MLKKTILIGLMLCGMVQGATYYVDSADGNDTTGDGSSGSPYKTIPVAWAEATSGDTIELADGNYPYLWLNGTADAQGDTAPPVDVNTFVTIKSTNRRGAIIDYDVSKSPRRCMTLGGRETIGGNYDRYTVKVNFEQIKFNGMIYINTAKDVRLYDCEVYGFVGNYRSDETGFDTIMNALHCESLYTSWQHGILIRNSTSPTRYSKDIYIESCDIYNNFKNVNLTGINCTITDSNLHSFGSFNLVIGDGEQLEASNNIIYNGIQVNEGCTDYDQTHTNGIYFSGEPNLAIVTGNIIYDIPAQGVFVPDYNNGYIYGLTFTNNIVYGCGATSFNVCRLNGGLIANNTILGTATFYAGGNSPNYDCLGIYCFNNIFGQYNTKDFALTTEPFLYSNYNIYQTRSDVGVYKTIGDNEPNSLAITDYDLSEPLTDYTMFVDSDSNNFNLISDAQAVNFGISLYSAPTIDLSGNSRDATPDAGCYEYLSGGVVVPTAPSNSTATAVDHQQINLIWTDNAANESDYRIYRSSTSSSAGFSIIDTISLDSEAYSDTGLTASTQYWYKIYAYNSAGLSSSTDCNTTTDAEPTPPEPITGVRETLSALYMGDYEFGDTLYMTWDSTITDGNIAVYRGNNASGLQGVRSSADVNGITDIRGFAGLTGINNLKINTASNSTFYLSGYDYSIVLKGATYDSNEVNFALGSFSIQNRYTPSTDISQTSTKVDNLYNQFNNVYFEKIDNISEKTPNQMYGN